MNQLTQHYGDCRGPLGLPCFDQQATALDQLLRSVPRDELHAPGYLVTTKGISDLVNGERADVSWISTEDLDRQREIVRAAGMNDDYFALNPVVTLNHNYDLPPVGKSVWRRRAVEGGRVGIKAKTHYPPRPESWPRGELWYPDHAFTLIQADLLRGKSIGFLPTRVRFPTDEERERNPAMKNVWRIVEEWVLLEYACVFLPAQQYAVVQAVSKGMSLPPAFRERIGVPLPFTPLSEVEKHLQRRIDTFDFDKAREGIEFGRLCARQAVPHIRQVVEAYTRGERPPSSRRPPPQPAP